MPCVIIAGSPKFSYTDDMHDIWIMQTALWIFLTCFKEISLIHWFCEFYLPGFCWYCWRSLNSNGQKVHSLSSMHAGYLLKNLVFRLYTPQSTRISRGHKAVLVLPVRFILTIMQVWVLTVHGWPRVKMYPWLKYLCRKRHYINLD